MHTTRFKVMFFDAGLIDLADEVVLLAFILGSRRSKYGRLVHPLFCHPQMANNFATLTLYIPRMLILVIIGTEHVTTLLRTIAPVSADFSARRGYYSSDLLCCVQV